MWELNPGLSALYFQGMLTTTLMDRRYSENDLTTSPGWSGLPRCKSVASLLVHFLLFGFLQLL